MIFLTVGTLFPFDRLIKAVDQLRACGRINEEIFGQIGSSKYKPQSFEYVDMVEKKSFDSYVLQSTALIGHAGMGTITRALKHSKPLIVVPRLRKFGEHVNDHQVHTAEKFMQLGHVLAAFDEIELFEKIAELKSFIPNERTTQVDSVVERISKLLTEITDSRIV